jgi:hypothetical protein
MIIYAIVMLIVLPAAAFAFGLCRAAAKPTPKPDRDKILLNALNKTLDDYHAKRGTFAEGRPTMPSEVEPELEMERRTR